MSRPRLSPVFVYYSDGKRPEDKFLEDVLNYIDRADIERLQQISSAISVSYSQYLQRGPWQVRGNNVRRAVS